MADIDKTFNEGLWPLVQIWRKRRAPINIAPEDGFPDIDVDFGPMARRTILAETELNTTSDSGLVRRASEMIPEFVGKSYLSFFNSLLIMILRKRDWPAHAPALFNRLWREQGEFLCDELNPRWLISSIITFADHGETEMDRKVGQTLNVMFSMMKLYESERLYSGYDPSQPFPLTQRRNAPLPLTMPHFSLLEGDLEVNLIAPIMEDARMAPTAGPLAIHLLRVLNLDGRNMFRRLAVMRQEAESEQKKG